MWIPFIALNSLQHFFAKLAVLLPLIMNMLHTKMAHVSVCVKLCMHTAMQSRSAWAKFCAYLPLQYLNFMKVLDCQHKIKINILCKIFEIHAEWSKELLFNYFFRSTSLQTLLPEAFSKIFNKKQSQCSMHYMIWSCHGKNLTKSFKYANQPKMSLHKWSKSLQKSEFAY